jgi:hypothetical protein
VFASESQVIAIALLKMSTLINEKAQDKKQ